MNKTLIYTFIFFSNLIFSQEIYTKYTIQDFGSIEVSDKLELESKFYNKYKYEIIGVKPDNEPQCVFHQSGLNIGNGKTTYARLIINTQIASKGEYESYSSKNIISKQDSEELKEIYYSNFENSGIKITEWFGASNKIIANKYNSVEIKFIRQLFNQPKVLVHEYIIHNDDRIHNITISYRIDDKDYWESTMNKILNSIVLFPAKTNSMSNTKIQSLNNKSVFDERTVYELNSINNMCPQKINDESLLLSVKIRDNTIVYSIKLINCKQDVITGDIINNGKVFNNNQFKNDIKASLNQYLNSPIFKTLKDKNVNFEYEYLDRTNKKLFIITI